MSRRLLLAAYTVGYWLRAVGRCVQGWASARLWPIIPGPRLTWVPRIPGQQLDGLKHWLPAEDAPTTLFGVDRIDRDRGDDPPEAA